MNLLSILFCIFCGYIGYKAGKYVAHKLHEQDTINYEYYGNYDSSSGEVFTIKNFKDYLCTLTKVILTWLDNNECDKLLYKEIYIGRDNIITVERKESFIFVSLLYKNIRYAKWCSQLSGELVWYDNGCAKLDMDNTKEILQWFGDEGVISWRVKKIPV